MKATRQIIKIDNEKCDGCGQCVNACHEGALRIVDGKAVLVADSFCDGLGACIGECPQGALVFETREADVFDEAAVEKSKLQDAGCKSQNGEGERLPCGCPGTLARKLESKPSENEPVATVGATINRLQNWPVQLQLIPATAPYLKDAELILAAHCTAFAMPDFHERYLGADKVLAVACPKLDDSARHAQKLAQLLAANELFGITVVRMEVPCCGGLELIVRQALELSGKKVPVRIKTVNI